MLMIVGFLSFYFILFYRKVAKFLHNFSASLVGFLLFYFKWANRLIRMN